MHGYFGNPNTVPPSGYFLPASDESLLITRASMEQGDIAAAAMKKIAKEKADRIPELELLNRKGKNPAPSPGIKLSKQFDLLSFDKGKMTV
uniref:Uncharacterized protein n=1 Tax=Tanacetum cinerariifolium TaxID=118510 RepID=A0A6L2J7R7_TANCI|nr:hypothetical protein [Tanacetum cinerariifolium]